MKNYFVCAILLFPAFLGFTQTIGYNVFGTHTNPYSGPYSILTLDTLQEAKTLQDINGKYRADWVASYIAVEVSSTCDGVVRKARGKNDTLTQAQIDILKMADLGCRIDVEVEYIPANHLKYNPPRKMDFSLTPIPIVEAKYPGGAEQLNVYLKENIVDKIAANTLEQVKLGQVRFQISEEGLVFGAQVFKTSENDKIDTLVLEALCNMPKWSPAENSKGGKITQEFEFSIGTVLLLCPAPYVY